MHARIEKKEGLSPNLTLMAEHRPQVALEQRWETLPEVDRRHALQTLSRIVAQQTFGSQNRKEVRHEDC